MFEDDSRPAASANAEVARLFAEIGDILEIKGEPPYRYNAYRTAARSGRFSVTLSTRPG